MSEYELLERLKVEAERWIAGVAGDPSMTEAASRGLREIIDKAHMVPIELMGAIDWARTSKDGYLSELQKVKDSLDETKTQLKFCKEAHAALVRLVGGPPLPEASSGKL